jgi:hypothetical protein
MHCATKLQSDRLKEAACLLQWGGRPDLSREAEMSEISPVSASWLKYHCTIMGVSTMNQEHSSMRENGWCAAAVKRRPESRIESAPAAIAPQVRNIVSRKLLCQIVICIKQRAFLASMWDISTPCALSAPCKQGEHPSKRFAQQGRLAGTLECLTPMYACPGTERNGAVR